MQVQFIWLF